MGVHERNSEASGATLFNTLLYIDDQGTIIGKHWKLIPTGGERLVWGQGDGNTLPVFDTSFGKLGGLLCWENYVPLARQAMYLGGFESYCIVSHFERHVLHQCFGRIEICRRRVLYRGKNYHNEWPVQLLVEHFRLE